MVNQTIDTVPVQTSESCFGTVSILPMRLIEEALWQLIISGSISYILNFGINDKRINHIPRPD